MSAGLHTYGEEFLVKLFSGNESSQDVEVGLYNSSDSLSESNDIGDITTEPNTGDTYARQTVSLPSSTTDQATTSNWETIFDTISFDVSGNSEDVNSYFVLINFDSTEAGDGGSASDHIMFTGDLSQTFDLNSITSTFAASNVGIQIEDD